MRILSNISFKLILSKSVLFIQIAVLALTLQHSFVRIPVGILTKEC